MVSAITLPNLSTEHRYGAQINSALRSRFGSNVGSNAAAQAAQKRQGTLSAIGSQLAGSSSASVSPVSKMTSNLSQDLRNSAQAASDAQAKRVLQERAQAQYQRQAADFENTYRSEAANFAGARTTSNVKGGRGTVLNKALGLLGTPYAWGQGNYNSGPGYGVNRGRSGGSNRIVKGVDCSGLVAYALGSIGLTGPRSSAAMVTSMGYRTSVKNAQPGDLVGWSTGSGGVVKHVALYLGNGKIVESTPGKGVSVRSISGDRGVFAVHLNY